MKKLATTGIVQHKNHPQEILLVQRMKDGLWEFPGGKIDAGESPERCIQREIEEELSIKVRIDKFLGALKGLYRSIDMEVFAFLTTWTGGELKLNVHRDLRWIKPLDTKGFSLVEEDREILKQFYFPQKDNS